ncbi:hypothetical protein G9C98_004974 [Cotesia typhae]|uniref:NAD-dependent epimerase/dehydratase domain-containing protein n=1 Tax=Cotesia typhae TaxID=2053667 RepID=A0A8J5RBR3_9HYME|nr:hypothetical protein G9C98_004974 [Cotesia typhae]
MATPTNNRKPGVIILGGCGFIGRNLAAYLVKKELVSYIRIVDKVPPQTAWLNKKHQLIFENPIIEFKSANLINPVSCQNAFVTDNPIDYVFNCAGETKSGQTDPVYREEDDPTDPWTFIAKHKLQVENDLKNIPGLKYTILRPAIVYGIADKSGLAPRLVVGAVYKYLREMMKLLWGRNLHMNTVHIIDVARALWHVATRDDTISQVYNVVDEDDSTQGSISAMVSELFNINHDYWGITLSKLAKMEMSTVVEEVNDKHMGPWAEACNKDGIENSPLSPYIDQELLYNKHLYLDNGKLLKTGFNYNYPKVTKELLKEILDDYVTMKIFPHSLML